MEYEIRPIYPFDRAEQLNLLNLLAHEGISAEQNMDYTAGLYDVNGQLAATGSYYRNTLRCLAVEGEHRGEGLLNIIVSHLTEELAARGVFDIFLYTKYETTKFFRDLGFYPIAEVDRRVVFMENSKSAFPDYLTGLAEEKAPGERVAAIVMNANPFTLGHQYLAEKASPECDVLHLFIVREDISDFPFAVRERLIREGTAHLKNLVYHDTGNYIVSSATFPSYFIQDSEEVTRAHARVDAAVFGRIAQSLGIRIRYVGDEPFSFATNLYNQVMSESLPEYGVELRIIPRREDIGNTPISASRVREMIKAGNLETLRQLVPKTTYAFLASQEGLDLAASMRDK
ncbi:MAG: [citrate (pro-3S)-lyase] ligase [Eubacteriales bacterium]|nr:[citrate (pro-3S)-lyase] ligase [Eubacteriales bacterium]MDD4135045.1 [citrate (pro-3S)-lyase] ligase [Eubacteriales bacterium]